MTNIKEMKMRVEWFQTGKGRYAEIQGVTPAQMNWLMDALKKGASRHESYAKFYGKSRQVEKHAATASGMYRMLHALQNSL